MSDKTIIMFKIQEITHSLTWSGEYFVLFFHYILYNIWNLTYKPAFVQSGIKIQLQCTCLCKILSDIYLVNRLFSYLHLPHAKKIRQIRSQESHFIYLHVGYQGTCRLYFLCIHIHLKSPVYIEILMTKLMMCMYSVVSHLKVLHNQYVCTCYNIFNCFQYNNMTFWCQKERQKG